MWSAESISVDSLSQLRLGREEAATEAGPGTTGYSNNSSDGTPGYSNNSGGGTNNGSSSSNNNNNNGSRDTSSNRNRNNSSSQPFQELEQVWGSLSLKYELH